MLHHWSRQQLFLRWALYAVAIALLQEGAASWSTDFSATIARAPEQLSRCLSLKSIKAASGNPSLDATQQLPVPVVQSNIHPIMTVDDAILNRYSCKNFRRYRPDLDDSTTTTTPPNSMCISPNGELTPQPPVNASDADPSVIQRALESLNLARHTPTAFNTQPYKVVLVTSPEQKMALSKHCLGPNRQRVLDSDCTAIFLADKQITRTLATFRQFTANVGKMKQRKPLTNNVLMTMQFYITIFSSGYPLPRLISSSISFIVRTCMAWLNFFINMTKWFKYPLPTLSNAETWSSKQVTMVAMTYMLACTARGLATIPMEGINASGIRKVIKAPSRYAIPLIVSTGIPYNDQKSALSDSINVRDNRTFVDMRYKLEELMFGDTFGAALPILSS